MKQDPIAKAIFITNTFAQAHPKEHIALWTQFEKEVPVNKRTGAYGADNLAYVKWLKEQNNPTVMEFTRNDIMTQSF